MRVALEVSSTDEGVLVGSASWSACEGPVPFHGTLELLALLEAAADPRRSDKQSHGRAAD
jgi:hypothetical protein